MEEQAAGKEPTAAAPSGFSIKEAFSASSERMRETRAPARRRISFILDLEAVAVDDELVKGGEVEITLQTLSALEEQKATSNANTGVEIGFAMASRSIYKVGGESLSQGAREWFWNAIGPGGRTIITGKYSDLSTPGDEALKKADETVRLGG